jgi:hypothetical protein
VYSPSKGVLEIKDANKKKHIIKEVEHPIEKWLEVIERCRVELHKKRLKKQIKHNN